MKATLGGAIGTAVLLVLAGPARAITGGAYPVDDPDLWFVGSMVPLDPVIAEHFRCSATIDTLQSSDGRIEARAVTVAHCFLPPPDPSLPDLVFLPPEAYLFVDGNGQEWAVTGGAWYPNYADDNNGKEDIAVAFLEALDGQCADLVDCPLPVKGAIPLSSDFDDLMVTEGIVGCDLFCGEPGCDASCQGCCTDPDGDVYGRGQAPLAVVADGSSLSRWGGWGFNSTNLGWALGDNEDGKFLNQCGGDSGGAVLHKNGPGDYTFAAVVEAHFFRNCQPPDTFPDAGLTCSNHKDCPFSENCQPDSGGPGKVCMPLRRIGMGPNLADPKIRDFLEANELE